ncbi:MAG TPA: amidohydrolase family protein [Candidatus Polarisedimenticolaceae bacterium]|nr:amidohydrolase family protein [Candidatus Polarisedimenticolaceae bacterium]
MGTKGRWETWLAVAIVALALGAKPTHDAEEKKKDEVLPLQPERHLQLDTDEGTWLSLDVSPDGRTLVFDLLGDLYRLPIEGGPATRITSGLPFDGQPRFSPDGQWLAFISDRDGAENLWISRADGSDARKLSKEADSELASPSWTPDGQYVLVSRQTWPLAAFELWMYHVQGGTGVQVTKAKPQADTPAERRHNALGAICSPDGRYFYYARKLGRFQYNADFPMWQIARRDRITGDEDLLTEAPGSAMRPLLSPDGKQLVYATRQDGRTGLRLRDLGNGSDRWLAYPVQRDDQESRYTRDLLPGYAFLPGGRELVLAYDGKIRRLDLASGTAREIPFHVSAQLDLGPRLYYPLRVEEGPVRSRLIQDPSLSPDGKRLAFSALTHLYVAELPAAVPRRVASGDAREFQPAWSPDGQWLAYVSWSEQGGHLWKIRADGGGAQQLDDAAAFYADPVWTPDGTQVLALRGSAYERLHRTFDFGQVAAMDLVALPAGGGPARLIVPARGRGKPHFGPERDRVYLFGEDGLLSLRLDGTDRREVLKLTGPGLYFNEDPVPADDVRISPDGHWALALASNQLYVVAVPQLGGPAPTVNLKDSALPLKKLTSVGADYFGWADGGKTLTWAVGATFYRQPLSSVKFEPPAEAAAADKPKTGKAKPATPPEVEPPLYQATAVVLEVPRHTPRGSVVLRGATLITMRGDEVLHDADLVVRDNRIAAVGPRGQVSVPADARVIDVAGMTITPGFVDTHAHWFEIRRGVLDVQNWSFLANLAYGVTCGLDVQTSTNDMFAYQDLVDSGEILGLRAYSTGPGIFSNNQFQSKQEARGVLEKYKEHYRTRHLKSYIVGNRKQREFVVQAARELEMMPTTEGGLDLKLELTHAFDGFRGSEHALPIVPLSRDVVELMARSGIGYTPTLLVAYGGPFAENDFYTTFEVHDDAKLRHFVPHSVLDAKARRVKWFRRDEHVYPRLAAEAAKIVRAGGRVGIGSHGQLQGLGYHWEMWALASGGLTPLEVLRCATLHGAEMIGYGQDLGSLEPGKLADLIVLERDPLADIRNTNSIRYVMKNGELFRGDTLDRVWPRERPLPALWWWDERP